jgi:hypothetical protein
LVYDFKIGFWHTFGTHANESPKSILARKQEEIRLTGRTYWSFQPRRTLEAWREEIQKLGDPPVLVFCSHSPKARSPNSPTSDCSVYKFNADDEWKAIPNTIRVPHNFPTGRTHASAFIVRKISAPGGVFSLAPPQWFSERKGNLWSSDNHPTRPGETLIRPGGNVYARMLRFCAILELEAPYLAYVGITPTRGSQREI